jgi:hypothetical protein
MDVPVSVRVRDPVSETYNLIVRGTSVPENSTIFGAFGPILPNSNGDYVLTEEDTAAFEFQAPLHFSDVVSYCLLIENLFLMQIALTV